VKEIKGSKADKYHFEEEHNTAWYTFATKYDGSITLDIIPVKPTDDYDFLLFKYTDSTFCEQVKLQKIRPIRSNISRNREDLKGITGLKMDAKDEFVGQGVKNAWSRYLDVKKGDRYYLVVDNVYPEGGGHTIVINYTREVELKGKVTNDENKPIVSEVQVSNSRGEEVAATTTKKDGTYSLKTTLNESETYSVTYMSDSTFVESKTLNLSNIKSGVKDLSVVLPELKKGKNYVFNNIIFEGNSDVVMPGSLSSMEALRKLMKRNKNLVIVIEGHVNGVGDVGRRLEYKQKLSEDRAMTVYSFLLDKGIEKERMSTYGYGERKMLFPQGSFEQQEKNRRVEIKVVSF
jgi:outer membrane protein OmpA-like peptidoglycan-associated protein